MPLTNAATCASAAAHSTGDHEPLLSLARTPVACAENCRGARSWDRQPFFNATGDGTYVGQYREIYNNFWINNFNPQEATDNDDG